MHQGPHPASRSLLKTDDIPVDIFVNGEWRGVEWFRNTEITRQVRHRVNELARAHFLTPIDTLSARVDGYQLAEW